MSSKAARLRHRQAARQRRIKRQRKCGRVPQHTVTERKRQALEWRAEREARRSSIGLVRRGAVVALGAVAGGIMAGVLSLSPASVAVDHRAGQHGYYRAFVTGPDRRELPHDDGPDITEDDPFTPYVVTGAPGHYPAGAIPLAAPPGPVSPEKRSGPALFRIASIVDWLTDT